MLSTQSLSGPLFCTAVRCFHVLLSDLACHAGLLERFVLACHCSGTQRGTETMPPISSIGSKCNRLAVHLSIQGKAIVDPGPKPQKFAHNRQLSSFLFLFRECSSSKIGRHVLVKQRVGRNLIDLVSQPTASQCRGVTAFCTGPWRNKDRMNQHDIWDVIRAGSRG